MPSTPPNIPTAIIRPRRRFSAAWVLPVLALMLVGGLMYRTWSMRGTPITIVFADGHGLRPGDELRFRGIVVGEVDETRLSDDLTETIVEASLDPDSTSIARRGTQFWIVRPRIAPNGVQGLDTLVGPRYIALRPGSPSAPRRTEFIGQQLPPLVDELKGGDLEIVVESTKRGSLQVGGPVLFRQVHVGTILSVELASDGSAVEARLHIEQAYAPLVQAETKFWDSGGVEVDMGLTGVSMDIESLAALMLGGVSFATPPESGEMASTGHRFTLHDGPQEEWLEWDPAVAIGSDLLPPGSRVPHMERARKQWRSKVLGREKTRSGWVLAIAEGVVGPDNLLRVEADGRDGSSTLAMAGNTMALAREPYWSGGGLAIMRETIDRRAWPERLMKSVTEPVDCLVVTSGSDTSMALAVVRLTQGDGFWQVDEAISFDDRWHGACVLSREDGMLVGLLLVDDGMGRVALLPASVDEDR